MPNVLPQSRSPEDHAEVGPQGVASLIGGADLLTHHPAWTVTAEDELRVDHRRPAVQAGHLHADPAVVLDNAGHHHPGGEGALRQLLDGLAQHLFEDVLRSLLAKFGESVAFGHESQHAGEARQFMTGQRRAEHHVL